LMAHCIVILSFFFPLLSIVHDDLVDRRKKQLACYLVHAEKGVHASTKVFFNGLRVLVAWQSTKSWQTWRCLATSSPRLWATCWPAARIGMLFKPGSLRAMSLVQCWSSAASASGTVKVRHASGEEVSPAAFWVHARRTKLTSGTQATWSLWLMMSAPTISQAWQGARGPVTKCPM
jgi:hypothetical protein